MNAVDETPRIYSIESRELCVEERKKKKNKKKKLKQFSPLNTRSEQLRAANTNAEMDTNTHKHSGLLQQKPHLYSLTERKNK